MLPYILGALFIALVVVAVLVLQPSGGGKKQTQKAVKPSNTAVAPTKKSDEGISFQIVPRDYDKRIEYWDDTWRFEQYDIGSVEFEVAKESGLIVTFSTHAGYPKDGYAVIFDQRGSGDTNLYDSSTSVTYISRLPNINGAASAHANVRNVELAGTPRHVRVTYQHGVIEVFVNGEGVLRYKDPAPPTQIQYVGFGHTGIQSGIGRISRMRIH